MKKYQPFPKHALYRWLNRLTDIRFLRGGSKHVNLLLPPEYHTLLKAYSRVHRTGMTALIRKAVRDMLVDIHYETYRIGEAGGRTEFLDIIDETILQGIGHPLKEHIAPSHPRWKDITPSDEELSNEPAKWARYGYKTELSKEVKKDSQPN